MRVLLIAAVLALAACNRGGDENLGAASTGNSLTPAQIDAALGPANQQASVNSLIDENETLAANAGVKESHKTRK